MSKFRGFYEFTDIVNSDEELMLQNLGGKNRMRSATQPYCKYS